LILFIQRTKEKSQSCKIAYSYNFIETEVHL